MPGVHLNQKYAGIGIVVLLAVAWAGLKASCFESRRATEAPSLSTAAQKSMRGASREYGSGIQRAAQSEAGDGEEGLDCGNEQRTATRLQAGSEEDASQKNEMAEQDASAAKFVAKPELNEAQEASSGQFVAAVQEGLNRGDSDAVQTLLKKARQDVALVGGLKTMVGESESGLAMQRYAAEALVRIGTADSVQFVLDQLLAADNAGDTERVDLLLAALEAPTTTAGMWALFDLLLGRGGYAQAQGSLPAEVASGIRKSLRAAPDRETVGKLAAELYLDPQVMTNSEAMWELDEVSSPVMLAELAGRAYKENRAENAAELLDRLGQSDDQGVVQAIVQMVPNQSVPLDDVGMALYNWSIRHPQEALPGLFLEYLTDSSRPPEQRSVAGFGLAGTTNRDNARAALEKALQSERDPIVQTNLQRALTVLDEEQAR